MIWSPAPVKPPIPAAEAKPEPKFVHWRDSTGHCGKTSPWAARRHIRRGVAEYENGVLVFTKAVSREWIDAAIRSDPDDRICSACGKSKIPDAFRLIARAHGRVPSRVCIACERETDKRRAASYQEIRCIREKYAEGSHTEAEWAALLLGCGNECLRCGTSGELTNQGYLTRDHVVPLSRGGSDSISNIQPLCQSCNSWKYTREIDFRPKH